ncbi:HNH endonuclease signature motif containing protein [Mycobacterium paragordonae]|uniref:HNH endonuclease signature motif containing protein n=1 Tax=Mycobacterium paragordonae TaxID=1389713 RepID=A0AAJ1RZB1_9MYCO|nr:HNH endonuclease signature motif containing protein [Mycobacterium paragordonae]MDP7733612.1 HNH endonuclease signature motif containing protein [Mycobacterium paragordonae]
MSSSTCEEIAEALGGLEACAERLCELTFEAPDTAGLLGIIDAMSRVVRTLRVPGHAVINQLDTRATNAELGGSLGQALADRLRITKTDAHRLIAEAADLGPRRALTGQPLSPVLPATAAAQRRGHLSDANLAVIRKFFAKLPDTVDAATRAYAEDKLALAATGFRPDELSEYAQVLKDCLKPDGDFSPDEPEPTRTRGITLGRQQPDGMSQIRGLITPELRATLEPVIAKLAAPGMCNPDDPTPVIDGRAPAEAVDRDTRTPAQRTHDALQTALRTLLKSGKLGQHHGLPTTIIITTTLAELEAGAGRALTAGGTLLPMSDVIRLASPAHHYLTIFHKDKTLALYHGKRLANPEQRLALLGKDRGCTRPGCTVPGYWTQAHHLEGWMNTRRTHIDELGLACPPDNRLVELHKYTTRRNIDGIVEWRPPKHLDVGRPRTNCMHHPERPLTPEADEP